MRSSPITALSVECGRQLRDRGHHDQRCSPTPAEAFHAIVAAHSRRRIATRLAVSLALVHGIRLHETALVPWLTNVHCASNGAALAQWVLDQLSGFDPAPLQDESERFDTLSQRLARLLADLTETQPC